MPEDRRSWKYTPKKVVSLAPDALVYINGEETATTCVRCRKESRVVDDITDLSITASLEAKNNASFTIIAPRYDKDRWLVRGTPVIKPMHEVEIYMRGRFLVDGEARYYPVFWGCVISVAHSYSDGNFKLSIECEGILRWWELSKINVQPSMIATQTTPSTVSPSPWINIFGDSNPYDIIWYLATKTTGGLLAPEALTSETIDGDAVTSRYLNDLDTEIMDYWNLRFSQVGRALRMFGFEGEIRQFPSANDLAARGQDKRNSIPPSELTRLVRPRGEAVTENIESFRPFGQVAKGYDLFASEITSKLEIATQIKNTINYEFYQDVTGELIFKPPFYNIDVRPYPAYVIDPIDIISLDVTESESEIYTRIDVRGSWHDIIAEGTPSLQPSATYVDPDLAKKFGVRAISVNQNYLRNSEDCFAFAVGELDRLNKRRWSGSMTIKGRPELRIGFPVYVTHIDTFFYVTSISHSFSFGGTFNTTLGLEAARRRVYETSKSGTTGAPLKFHVYRGKTVASAEQELDEARFAEALASQGRRKTEPVPQEEKVDEPTAAEKQQVTLMAGQTVSVQATVFNKPERDDRVTRVTRQNNGESIVVPFTDGEGYEVIGGYEYGRNIQVNTKGGLSIKGVAKGKDQTIGSLSTAIEEVDFKTGPQELIGTDKQFIGVSENFLDAALYMTPKELNESEIKSLDPAFDATLESGKSGVTKSLSDERKSILSLEPGLRKRDEKSKCVCHRDDKRIEPLERRKSLNSPDTSKRASLQPEVLKDRERFFELLQKQEDLGNQTGLGVQDNLTEAETTELNRLRRSLQKAGAINPGEF